MLTQELFILINQANQTETDISQIKCNNYLSQYLKEELLEVMSNENIKEQKEQMITFVPYFYRKRGDN